MKLTIIPVTIEPSHDNATVDSIIVAFETFIRQLGIKNDVWITDDMQFLVVVLLAMKFPKIETFNLTCQLIRNHNFCVLQRIRHEYLTRVHSNTRN